MALLLCKEELLVYDCGRNEQITDELFKQEKARVRKYFVQNIMSSLHLTWLSSKRKFV